MPGFHHVELWLADPAAEFPAWAWFLDRVGFTKVQEWPDGQSWDAGGAYLTLTASPNTEGARHNRRQPGLNHLAFHGGSRAQVDALMADAAAHSWSPLYHDRYPHAGGPDHYAGWLENPAGYKVEVVAGE